MRNGGRLDPISCGKPVRQLFRKNFVETLNSWQFHETKNTADMPIFTGSNCLHKPAGFLVICFLLISNSFPQDTTGASATALQVNAGAKYSKGIADELIVRTRA